MTTLGILQNQWGHSAARPDHAERIARLEALSPDRYASHVRWCLETSGCMTYRRLVRAFGEAAFGSIVWTNASRNAGATASSRFAASTTHLDATLRHYRPDAVVAFGRVAAEGLQAWARTPESASLSFEAIATCHPVARHAGAGDELRAAVALWKKAVGWREPAAGESR